MMCPFCDFETNGNAAPWRYFMMARHGRNCEAKKFVNAVEAEIGKYLNDNLVEDENHSMWAKVKR